MLDNDHWHEIAAGLGLSGISAQLAAHCTVRRWDGKRLVLALDPDNRALLVGSRALEKLEQALARWLGRSLKVEIELAQPATETPARRAAREARERKEAMLERLGEDPVVRMLQETFDAGIQEESLELLERKR
jgi:DNA polymerase-3 subunit gamma/tau